MPKPNENIWLCIKALAASLDGPMQASEQMIDDLERNLRSFPHDKQRGIDHEMTIVIAQLSRLKLRLQKEYL